MFIPLVLRLVLVFIVISAGRGGRPPLRVYRGDTASSGDFAFAVVLQFANEPFRRFCTGSLIASNWVLTAGHCIPEMLFHIRYGDYTLPWNKTKLYTDVIQTFIHPNFKAKMAGAIRLVVSNDIALVLVEKVPKKYGKLLALDYKTLVGLSVKYAGFGLHTYLENKPTSKQVTWHQTAPLQVGEGAVIPCAKFMKDHRMRYPDSGLYSKWVMLWTGPKICVASKCSNRLQGVRGGDSGGPLVYDGRIIGITSCRFPPNNQLLFTPVSIYLEWIQQVIRSN